VAKNIVKNIILLSIVAAFGASAGDLLGVPKTEEKGSYFVDVSVSF
jgi:hypothetical protein